VGLLYIVHIVYSSLLITEWCTT